jgi:hypothetical protein
MNDDDAETIRERLNAAGFVVLCKRISDAPGNSLWRASAIRGGREWSTLGRDTAATLLNLEKHLRETDMDRCGAMSGQNWR